MPAVSETILANGLKVLLVEEHKAPVVTFHIWYRVGSRNERLGRTGLAHLLEHMMFKGTTRFGPGEFSAVIQRNGGRDNAFTSRDYTGYFELLAADRVELPITMEADRMVNLRLDAEDFARERSVVMEERRLRTEDDPVSSLFEESFAAAFKAHPYGQPIIGWMSDLEQLTVEDLREFYRQHYVPNNAVIVVVGDFQQDQLLAKIREAFEPIPRAPVPARSRSIEPPQEGERRITLRRPAELPFVLLAYHVPNLRDPDSIALDVLEVVLAGGKSARLYRDLVYEKQLALSAGASNTRVSIDPHLFFLYASVMPEKTAAEVEDALLEAVKRVATEGVSARELQKAKNQLEADFILSQDSIYNLARQIASYELAGGWRGWREYLAGVRAVTAGDLRRVAAKYFAEKNRTVGVLLPGAGGPPRTHRARGDR